MLYLGADHAGFKLKEKVKKWLDKEGVSYKDVGAVSYEKTDDYPVYGAALANHIKGRNKGILFCGSSYRVCIVANKSKGVRAVSVSTIRDAKLSREHNDANVLCLSGWHVPFKAKKLINTWLHTEMSTESRHKRRVREIKQLEEQWK